MNQVDFSELTRKREDWVRANKENGFDEGITNLLIELYPDNAHFIYELLQNAEDADATEVHFELTSEKLNFSHNGTMFTTQDIDGITSIGQGTKADDINKIGKFGVGFKAVFAYTATPKIYSGKYSFEIQNLVIPNPIEDINTSTKTLMIFPFNHIHSDKQKQKTKNDAYREIQVGLEKIKDNTLLFLTSIKKLTFSIDSQEEYIERIENNEKIQIVNSKKKTTSYWLRFKKYLKDSQKLYVSIAYNLDGKQENIQPLTNGQVSIFFPAEKESSNLKFHIHAPFASTVARDSIKDLEENKNLLNLISELTCESLAYIKDNDLLNTKFLSCLPNENDNLSGFYLPIQKKLVDTFNEEDYLLCDDDIYRPANICCKSTKKIKSLISQNLLPYFTLINEHRYLPSTYQLINKYWLKDMSKGNRVEGFLNLLNIDTVTQDIFLDTLSLIVSQYITPDNINSDTKEIELKNLILKKDDEWFSKVYEYCYKIKKGNRKYHSFLEYKKLIRLSNNQLNIGGKDAYFSDNNFSDYPIVKKEVYIDNEDAKNFLSKILGVKEIGSKEKIEVILKTNYKKDSFPDDDLHLEHINKIVKFYINNKSENIDFLNKYMFLKGIDNKKKKWWCIPSNVTLDTPYEDTGLKVFTSLEKVYFLDDIYLQLDKKIKESFVELLKKLGSPTSIGIKKYNIYEKLNSENYQKLRKKLFYATESDYCSFTDYALCQKNILNFTSSDAKASLLVWDKIRELGKYYFKASYKAHARSGIVYTDSILILQLKNSYMIPDEKGIFHKPEDISQDMLPKGFVYDNRNGWLDAIGFGINVTKNKELNKEQEQLIIETAGGHDLEDIEALKNIDKDEFKKFIESQKIKDSIDDNQSSSDSTSAQTLGESLNDNQSDGNSPEVVSNPNNQTSILDDDKHQNDIKDGNDTWVDGYSRRNGSRREDKNGDKQKEIIRDFLYKEYMGHCQICGDTFAYKSENIFKRFSLNRGKSRDVVRKGNSISLCLKHHRIFELNLQKNSYLDIFEKPLSIKWINNNDKILKEDWVCEDDIEYENKIYKAFYRLKKGELFIRDEVYFLPIRLFTKEEYIKFTKAHIQEFIEVWNEN